MIFQHFCIASSPNYIIIINFFFELLIIKVKIEDKEMLIWTNKELTEIK